MRLDARLATERQALQTATDARDAARRELGQAEKRYGRCAVALGPRPKRAAGAAAGDGSSLGPRRQLQVRPLMEDFDSRCAAGGNRGCALMPQCTRSSGSALM